MAAISFRQATSSDAAAIGALHVASWRETYAGILPDDVLNGLSADERSDMWRDVLNDPAMFGGAAVFVAEGDAEIVGFGACGGQRDEGLKEQGFAGEIGAIYVLRSHQRAGVGKALISLMAGKLIDQGRSAASLWVLRDNLGARSFYERLGGALVGERVEEQSGVMLAEVAYGWNDPALVR
jgi:ribosomal protein S18 acetylase RimI-like enzyme